MVGNLKIQCSFSSWYPQFIKDSLEAVILQLPDNIVNYLEHDAFLLPLEATNNKPYNLEWSDGSSVNPDITEDSEDQPTFPVFSEKVQSIINKYGAVFIKTNWSTPSDAMWVAPTKTLKCTSLEDIYLLLKSSDRISRDLSSVKSLNNNKCSINFCLVLKRWHDINPASEFCCFVVNKILIGICQRDVSQYYKYIEDEKYDIQNDIKTFFLERIKDRFKMDNYSFDVIRYKKDKVKIVDFGLLNESVTKGTLFSYKELLSDVSEVPEFRYIAEEMGIQPKMMQQFCIPREINEFFQSSGQGSVMDALRKEVEEQNREDDGHKSDTSE